MVTVGMGKAGLWELGNSAGCGLTDRLAGPAGAGGGEKHPERTTPNATAAIVPIPTLNAADPRTLAPSQASDGVTGDRCLLYRQPGPQFLRPSVARDGRRSVPMVSERCASGADALH